MVMRMRKTKLTPPQAAALEAAAKHADGKFFAEGSGQCQLVRRLARLGFGRCNSGATVFTIDDDGRAVIKAHKAANGGAP